MGREGRREQAQPLFNKITSQEVARGEWPNLITCSSLIKAYGDGGEWAAGALKLMRRMSPQAMCVTLEALRRIPLQESVPIGFDARPTGRAVSRAAAIGLICAR